MTKLDVVPAASAEDGTRGRDALRGRLDQIGERRVNVLADFEAREFTGQNERREDDTAVDSGQRVAAVDPLFDPEFV